MFRTLDRYIVREILPPFLIVLAIFTFLLEMQPIMEVAERLVAKGVAWQVVLRVLPTLLPQALALTIPMALLIGLLIALGRLSADREWVAFQACGVSLFRLLRPAIALGLAGWAATSYVIIVALPEANQTYREITYSVVAARAESEVKPRVFFEDFPNQVLYVRDIQPGVPGWSDVFLADTNRPGEPVIYVARHGRMVLDRAKRRVEMVLENGTRHTELPDKYQALHFDRMVLTLDPESVFPTGVVQKGEREMTIAELQARIADLRRQGISPHNAIMEIQKKFSIPFACVVFVIIGVGLGLTSRRESKLASFVLGIGVIFAYYVIMWMSQSLAKGALLPAQVAMWVPTIILGSAGLVLLVWRARFAERRLSFRLPFRARSEPEPAAAATPGSRRFSRRLVLVIRVPHMWLPGPNILDSYISRTYIKIFALAFAGLIGIFYISEFIDLSDKLFKGTTTLGTLLEYFQFATPRYIYFVIPLAGLISTLVTLGLLTKNSELVVMKACGISLYRAVLPLVVFGLLSSGLLFALEESVLADATRRAQAIRHVIRGGEARTFDVLNRRWVVGKDGAIYHYLYFDPRKNELGGVSIYELDPKAWHLTRRTSVTAAAYPRVGSVSGSSKQLWHATEGRVREFGVGAELLSFTAFRERDLDLEPPEYFGTEEPDADRMTYRQLKGYIAELKVGGFNVVPYAVELQRKIAFPMVAIVMTLIAVPFAVTTGRRGAMWGVGVGIVLAMVYWTSSETFAALGSGGLIAPALAAWAPNVLFGTGATYLLLTVRT